MVTPGVEHPTPEPNDVAASTTRGSREALAVVLSPPTKLPSLNLAAASWNRLAVETGSKHEPMT